MTPNQISAIRTHLEVAFQEKCDPDTATEYAAGRHYDETGEVVLMTEVFELAQEYEDASA